MSPSNAYLIKIVAVKFVNPITPLISPAAILFAAIQVLSNIVCFNLFVLEMVEFGILS